VESAGAHELRRWWHQAGLTERQERIFHRIALFMVVVMTAGWALSIVETDAERRRIAEGSQAVDEVPAPSVTSRITTSLLEGNAKPAPYISEAALEFLTPLRGESGKLNAAFRTPGQPVAPDQGEIDAMYTGDTGTTTSPDFRAPEEPGIYQLAVQLQQATKPVKDLSIVTLVPFSEKKQGKIGVYTLGSWPYEGGGKPKSQKYANPTGFIEVTQENRDFNISEHFRLRDFLTKDQANVWPKYLLLQPELVDKLELVVQELEAAGVKVEHVHIMSGFRTPRYNHKGGNTAGRANLSRHMYGDGADFYVDNNRDAYPDDVTGDGRVTIKDAEFTASMAERVERKHPSLIGGVGIYVACCGHGPFVHVDVRGYRARWRGTGNG
jgi:uncharacterized protein YcbK (DUF882 family)